MSLRDMIFGPRPAPPECSGCKHAALTAQLAHEREKDFLATIEKLNAMLTSVANERLSRAFVAPPKDENAPPKQKRPFSLANLSMPQSADGHLRREASPAAEVRSRPTTLPAAPRT